MSTEKNRNIVMIALLIVLLCTSGVYYYKYISLNEEYKKNVDTYVTEIHKLRVVNSDWFLEGYLGVANRDRHLKINLLKYTGDKEIKLKSIGFRMYILDRDLDNDSEIIYDVNEIFNDKVFVLKYGEDMIVKSGGSNYNATRYDFHEEKKLQLSIVYEDTEGEIHVETIDIELSDYDIEPYL